MSDYSDLITGDMPGDKIQIDESHTGRADIIFPKLLEFLKQNGTSRTVVSVYGGSGVGKSEIASLLASRLSSEGRSAYVISGDNYPYRIPEQNDRERLNRFRYAGLTALASSNGFSDGQMDVLRKAWKRGEDSNPALTAGHEFMRIYQDAGREALEAYLGTEEEIDFDLINNIIMRFKNGDKHIPLKRMGRLPGELYFKTVDFSDVSVLLIEWTHGNNCRLSGVDLPVFLFSTPEETLAHRLSRARDRGADSPFTSLVLGIEQEMVNSQAESASIIIRKNGELAV